MKLVPYLMPNNVSGVLVLNLEVNQNAMLTESHQNIEKSHAVD
jgi:hypothetical protein